jgi:hypothetical protein
MRPCGSVQRAVCEDIPLAPTTTMNTHLYHARYLGGPWNGMVVVATRLAGEDRWSRPVVATIEQADSDGPPTRQICEAVYKLGRTCHLIDHGLPTVRYEYEFTGLEVAAPVTKSVTGVILAWLAIVKNRLLRVTQPNLWLPLPEGRPKRPGQADRLLSCPGRGLELKSN